MAWRDNYKKFMLFWAVAAHSWLIVQLISVFQNEDASDLSLPAFIIYTCSSLIWFTYGAFVLEERNYTLMISGTVSGILGVTTLAAIAKYGGSTDTLPSQDLVPRYKRI